MSIDRESNVFHRARLVVRDLGRPAVLLVALLPPTHAGETLLVSVSLDGTPGDGASGSEFGNQAISGNGRYVIFESFSNDLVAEDTNGDWDIFRRDRVKGTTGKVTVALSGDPAFGGGLNASVSANGRYVAFQSNASTHVEGDLNGQSDVFVRDLKKGVTTRVSVDSSGVEADGPSHNPRLSANGRYVVFQSAAENLVAEDGNEKIDIFLHDRKQGTTTRVSVGSAGEEAGADCIGATVSSSGRYVLFESVADDLVAEDLNETSDVFLHDLKLCTTVRASVDAAGTEADGPSNNGMISANGRYVVFESAAMNLVDDDGSSTFDVFVRDLKLGTVERLSVSESGAGGDNGSSRARITANGRFVVFESDAANLLADADRNGDTDVFLADRKLDTLRRVSVDSAGAEIEGPSADAAVSRNGRYIAFQSDSDTLADEDDNESSDVFLKDMK